MADHPDQLQLPLRLSAAPDVSVVHFPDGEIRLRPRAPLVTGSTADAARVLGLSPRQIRRMVHAGEIRAWRPGRRWLRIDMASVYALHKSRALGHTGQ